MVMKPIAITVNKHPVAVVIVVLIITGLMIGATGYFGINQEMSEHAFTPDIDIARADTKINEEYSAEYSTMMLIKAKNSDKDLITPEIMLEILELETELANDPEVNKGLEQPNLKEGNFYSVADILTITLIQQKIMEQFELLMDTQFEMLNTAINNSINEVFDGILPAAHKQAMAQAVINYISASMITVFSSAQDDLNTTLDEVLPGTVENITTNLNYILGTLENDVQTNTTAVLLNPDLNQTETNTQLQLKLSYLLFGDGQTNMSLQQILNMIGYELDRGLAGPIETTTVELSTRIGIFAGEAIGWQMMALSEELTAELNSRMAENISNIMGLPLNDTLAMLAAGMAGGDGEADPYPHSQSFEILYQTITSEVGTAMAAFGADIEDGLNNLLQELVLGFSDTTEYVFNNMLNTILGEVQPGTKTVEELNTTIAQQIEHCNSTISQGVINTLTAESLSESILVEIATQLQTTSRFDNATENVALALFSIMKQGALEGTKDLETMFSTGTGDNNDQLKNEFNELLASINATHKKTTLEGGNISLNLMGRPLILEFDRMDVQTFKEYINGIMLAEDVNYTQLQAGIEFLFTSEFDPENGETKAKGTIIMVLLNASYNDDARSSLEHRINKVCENYEKKETDNFEITTLGGSIIMDEIMGGMTESLMIIMPITFILVLIILALIYRNGFDMGISLLALLFSVLWVWGCGAALRFTFNPITMAIPVLIIGLGIDYGIHITMRYREELGYGKNVKTSINLTILSVGVALLLATVTTMVSFLSNVSSPISMLREFGILSAIGIFGSFITMITFVPACKQLRDERRLRNGKPLKYYNPKENPTKSSNNKKAKKQPVNVKKSAAGVVLLEKIMTSSAIAAERHPAAVIIVVLIITLASLYGAMNLETRFEMEDFLPEELEITQDFYFIRDEFGFEFESGGDTNILVKGDLTQPEVLIDIQNTINNAADNDFVQMEEGTNQLKAVSILSIMNEYATRTDLPGVQDLKYSVEFENMYLSTMDETGLPMANVTVVQISSLYDWFYNNPNKNIVKDVSKVLHRSDSGEYDGAVIRIAVNVDPNDGKKITKLFGQFEDDVKPLKENVNIDQVIITSGPILTYIIMSAMNESQTNTFVITIVVALILLIIVSYIRYRSIMLGIITILPVVLCVAWIWGSMYLLELPLNVMTITIASLTIGLGITYGIHISHRFTEDLETKSIEQAAISTVSHTGTALFGAAATTIAGFGILIFALLPPIQQFGGITAMTILYSFLASVFILPTFLVLWAKYREKHGKLKQNK